MTVEPFALPLDAPLDNARGRIERREGFLFRTDDGLGEATPLPGWTESLDDCRGALDAADDAHPDWQAALAACEGCPAARHAVSLARLDAESRTAGVPLYRHLGRSERVETVPVNATVGDGDVDATVSAAREAVGAGFGAVKVKVGARSVETDVDRLRAVREAVGSDVELRADANGAWTREEAARAFDALANAGVSYVEQPLPAMDLDGHRALRGGGMEVALDESLAEYDVQDVLDAAAASVLVLKPMALGGIDRARDAALAARDAGVDAVVTTTVDAVVARTAAVHLAASLPDVPACGLATADRLARDLADDPAPVRDGAMVVPQGKGNVPPVPKPG